MESSDLDSDALLKVVDSSVSRVGWRLRPPSRRRLHTDILALCTRLRPVVMVDYGGKMPELQQYLCGMLRLARQELTILMPLRVMIIEDMIYIIHVKELAEHALSSLSLQSQLAFVDLEKDPPEMLMHGEQNAVSSELVTIQKLFLSNSFAAEVNADTLTVVPPSTVTPKAESSQSMADDLPHVSGHIGFIPSDYVDMSSILTNTQITLPTLNGWLLGYPIVYLFSKEHVADAVYNLSTKSLHIYQILALRKTTSREKSSEEELMSFTVPYDLSLGGEKETWADTFLACLLAKLERCRHVWAHLRLEVSQCYPQAIAL